MQHQQSRPRREPYSRAATERERDHARDEPGRHSTSPRPPSLARRARMKSRSLSRLRYPNAWGFTATVATSATAWRSARRQVVRATCSAAAAGVPPASTKLSQRRERVAKAVARGFERRHVLRCDPQPALAMAAFGIERHRQVGTQVEQIVLHATQQVGDLGVERRRQSPRRSRPRSRRPSRRPTHARRPWRRARRRRVRSVPHRRRACRSCRGVPRVRA